MMQNVRRHQVTISSDASGVTTAADIGYTESGSLVGLYIAANTYAGAAGTAVMTISAAATGTVLAKASPVGSTAANTWYFPTYPPHDAGNFAGAAPANVGNRRFPLIAGENVKVTCDTDAVNLANKTMTLHLFIADEV